MATAWFQTDFYNQLQTDKNMVGLHWYYMVAFTPIFRIENQSETSLLQIEVGVNEP